jgi:hypothetical protein
METLFTGFGLSFAPGPGRNGQPNVVANMNGVKFELLGPPSQLNGIIVSATAPPQQIEMMIGQQRLFTSQLSPAAGSILNDVISEAKSKGQAQRSVEGASVEMTYKQQGQMVAYEYRVIAGG